MDELSESSQMYLKTIAILTKKQHKVRAIDVAKYMNFSKPSVSRALALLKNEKYLKIDMDGYLTLTNKGASIACKITDRYYKLIELFKKLGVSESNAELDACKIEHDLSDETFEKLIKLLEII